MVVDCSTCTTLCGTVLTAVCRRMGLYGFVCVCVCVCVRMCWVAGIKAVIYFIVLWFQVKLWSNVVLSLLACWWPKKCLSTLPSTSSFSPVKKDLSQIIKSWFVTSALNTHRTMEVALVFDSLAHVIRWAEQPTFDMMSDDYKLFKRPIVILYNEIQIIFSMKT